VPRDGDLGTPVKAEVRRLKSFAGETFASLQPGTPGPQDPHLDVPKPPNQEEAATIRDDDPRTPVKAEPQRGKISRRGGNVTAGTLGAQDPPSTPAVRALDAEQIKLLMKQGEQFIAAGDVVTARMHSNERRKPAMPRLQWR
jgi:hypothetical protein